MGERRDKGDPDVVWRLNLPSILEQAVIQLRVVEPVEGERTVQIWHGSEAIGHLTRREVADWQAGLEGLSHWLPPEG